MNEVWKNQVENFLKSGKRKKLKFLFQVDIFSAKQNHTKWEGW